MKMTNVANVILQFDSTHQRVDLKQLKAHALAVLTAVVWALFSGSGDLYHLLIRFGSMLLFMVLGRLLLGRLGTSRVSSLLLPAVALGLCVRFSVAELMLVNVYMATLLLVQEYFIFRSKLVALAIAIVSGLLIAGAGSYGRGLLTMVVAVVLGRMLWHALIERMGRKTFVIYVVKTIVIAVFVPTVYYVAHRVAGGYAYGLPSSLPAIHIAPLVWLVLAALSLRGLWSTLLLKTDRSPSYRPLRMFYVVFGVAYLVLAVIVAHYGQKIFTAEAMRVLGSMGFHGATISSSAYAFLATALLATAGIDRSLYKDNTLARKLDGLLRQPALSPNKVSRDK